MKLLAHALVRDVGPLPRLDQGAGWVRADGIAAAFTSVEPGQAHHDTSYALYHARVVASLHAQQTVIPLRFGTLLSGPEELSALVCRHAQTYLAVLKALDGCEEFGIRLVHRTPPDKQKHTAPAKAPSALAYMLRRRTEIAQQDRIDAEVAAYAREICAALTRMDIRTIVDQTRTRNGSQVSIDALIQRDAAAFREILASLPSHPAVSTQVSGPWPAYRFSAEFCRDIQLTISV